MEWNRVTLVKAEYYIIIYLAVVFGPTWHFDEKKKNFWMNIGWRNSRDTFHLCLAN